MPLYEYECTKCGHRFEVIQKFSDPPRTKCPECKGRLRKLLSAPAIQFKGSGWYVTDYAKRGGSAEKGVEKDAKAGGEPKETKEAKPEAPASEGKSEGKGKEKPKESAKGEPKQKGGA